MKHGGAHLPRRRARLRLGCASTEAGGAAALLSCSSSLPAQSSLLLTSSTGAGLPTTRRRVLFKGVANLFFKGVAIRLSY